MIPASRLLPALAWLVLLVAGPGRLTAQPTVYEVDPSRVRVHLGREGLVRFLVANRFRLELEVRARATARS